MPNKEVFEQLKDRGIRDNKLAMMIVSVPDELLWMLHEGKNNILVIGYSLLAILATWGGIHDRSQQHSNFFPGDTHRNQPVIYLGFL